MKKAAALTPISYPRTSANNHALRRLLRWYCAASCWILGLQVGPCISPPPPQACWAESLDVRQDKADHDVQEVLHELLEFRALLEKGKTSLKIPKSNPIRSDGEFSNLSSVSMPPLVTSALSIEATVDHQRVATSWTFFLGRPPQRCSISPAYLPPGWIWWKVFTVVVPKERDRRFPAVGSTAVMFNDILVVELTASLDYQRLTNYNSRHTRRDSSPGDKAFYLLRDTPPFFRLSCLHAEKAGTTSFKSLLIKVYCWGTGGYRDCIDAPIRL